MGREGAFANVGLRSRSGSNAFGTASPTTEQGGRAPIDRNAVGAWNSAAYVASLSAALNVSRSVPCAGPPRERLVLRSRSAMSDAAWILEASNIYPATKEALHLCKALIFLVFLAPRPGLEPGTYGLTGWESIGPLARMNACFSGLAFPILLGRFAERRLRTCPDRPLDIGSVHELVSACSVAGLAQSGRPARTSSGSPDSAPRPSNLMPGSVFSHDELLPKFVMRCIASKVHAPRPGIVVHPNHRMSIFDNA